jgi:hypothetical protein
MLQLSFVVQVSSSTFYPSCKISSIMWLWLYFIHFVTLSKNK